MRGTLHVVGHVYHRDGIIPACAGNTETRANDDVWAWDHPRVCGEHDMGLTEHQDRLGSSPRVRGTLGGSRNVIELDGIIPACAGNTWRIAPICSTCRDHPRVCGEHFWTSSIDVPKVGSSPRVRGTQVRGYRLDDFVGIIPACAGNTASKRPHRRRKRDHPRVCGEHAASCFCPRRSLGSSPRVRGTL